MKKAKKLTGEQDEKPTQDDQPANSLDQAVAKVNAGWRKQATEMMEFARLCLSTRNALQKDQRKLLMKRVEMGRAVFNKICAIADTPFLQLPEVQNKLPGGYSLRWECTKMKEADFMAAVDSGVIHPKITRKNLQALLPPKNSKAGKAKDSLLKITVDWSMPEYRKWSFQKWLRDGQDQFRGIEVNWESLENLETAEIPPMAEEALDEGIPMVPELEMDEATVFDDADAKETELSK